MNAPSDAELAAELAGLGAQLQVLARQLAEAVKNSDDAALSAVVLKHGTLLARVRQLAATHPALVKGSAALAAAARDEDAAQGLLQASFNKIREELACCEQSADIRRAYGC